VATPMSQVLITGGDGYIGRRFTRQLLEEQDVSLWVRAKDQDEFKSKGQKLCHEFCDSKMHLRLHWGDLTSGEPFGTIEPSEVETIIHAAAVTRFNVDRELAQKINVDGTKKILEFAERCTNLKQFVLLSTIYSSGLKQGRIAEEPFDGLEGFSNYYEWSKWSAEQWVLSHFSHLPWKILRIATVIADSNDGKVKQQNAFHNTLKLIFYGLLSILPGKKETPLYFVTGDFVSTACNELLNDPQTAKIYHVAHTRDESLTLGELIDVVFEIFEQEPDFKKRRILKPLYSDRESFKLLVEAVNQFGGGVVNQVVSSVAPFSQQLYLNKEISNTNLKHSMKQYIAPNAAHLIANTCRDLVETRWGKAGAGFQPAS
jgi:nucleoside-diphosphate-sugar epimerase